jgi:hypothetical protein
VIAMLGGVLSALTGHATWQSRSCPTGGRPGGAGRRHADVLAGYPARPGCPACRRCHRCSPTVRRGRPAREVMAGRFRLAT